MKILIVGMSHSIHTARWIQQFKDRNDIEIYLFPSIDRGASHILLEGVHVYHSVYSTGDNTGKGLQLHGFKVPFKGLASFLRGKLEKNFPEYRKKQLARVIAQLKPDIVHSMGIESSSWRVYEAKKLLKDVQFPKWLASNWGSDLYFFGQLSKYKERVGKVLKEATDYSCESLRDEKLARSFGFTGVVHPYIQAGGGWDLDSVEELRQKILPSKRKIILVKGYRHIVGRAIVALRALSRAQDVLAGYEVVIFSPIPEKDIRMLAEWFTLTTKIPCRVVGRTSNYREILELQAQARVFIGLSISDGVSNSFLESIVMGSFPVQSYPSSPENWIEDGVTGISVPPEDPEIIEIALRKALADDQLVDSAAEKNWITAKERLSQEILQEKAIMMYENIVRSQESQKE